MNHIMFEKNMMRYIMDKCKQVSPCSFHIENLIGFYMPSFDRSINVVYIEDILLIV